jgi:hypothetical protein
MKRPAKTRTRTASSIRRSLTIPRRLAVEVERGAEAEAAGRGGLNPSYRRFMTEADPELKGEAGKDLIRAVFGKDAIAGDSIL